MRRVLQWQRLMAVNGMADWFAWALIVLDQGVVVNAVNRLQLQHFIFWNEEKCCN
jgi:hypothetical protein